MEPIGYVRTPFPYKFGIPRQGSLIPGAPGVVHWDASRVSPGSFDGLQPGQNLWLLFVFHQSAPTTKAKVRLPRFKGATLGVFATRSPHRPNPIGMTLCQLESLDIEKQTLSLRGVDLVDGTPILDIKPYLPYADHPKVPGPCFAPPAPTLTVEFDQRARSAIETMGCSTETLNLVKGRIALDPRPESQKTSKSTYHLRHGTWDFTFYVQGATAVVTEIARKQ